MMEEGSLTLALASALVLIGGLVLETRVLLAYRTDLYFLASLPMMRMLVPIPEVPKGQGRTPSVLWEVTSSGMVRYWASPKERKAPSGLRGVVHFVPTTAGWALAVRWAPPWSPILAALWLAVLGIARDEAQLTVPIALMMVAAILFVYGQRAQAVAQELRFSFLNA